MWGKFKSLFGPGEEEEYIPPVAGPLPALPETPRELTRASSGLDQFFLAIGGQDRLKILDLCGSPSTTSYLFEQGHIVRPDPFHRALELAFGNGPEYLERQSEEDRIDIFVEHTLNHNEHEFDAVLAWDSLQYLRPELLDATVEQLHRVARPGAPILAVFHAEDRSGEWPVYNYVIEGPNRLAMSERERRAPSQYFHNRAIEKIFRNFASTKFFLARDHLREVLVKK